MYLYKYCLKATNFGIHLLHLLQKIKYFANIKIKFLTFILLVEST